MTDTVEWKEFSERLIDISDTVWGSERLVLERLLGKRAEQLIIPRDKLDIILERISATAVETTGDQHKIAMDRVATLIASVKEYGSINGAPVIFDKAQETLKFARELQRSVRTHKASTSFNEATSAEDIEALFKEETHRKEAICKELGIDANEAIALAKDPEKLSALEQGIKDAAKIAAESAAISHGAADAVKETAAEAGEVVAGATKDARKWYQFVTHDAAGEFKGGRTAIAGGAIVLAGAAYALTHKSKQQGNWQETATSRQSDTSAARG